MVAKIEEGDEDDLDSMEKVEPSEIEGEDRRVGDSLGVCEADR